jgi:hypothetical protein
VTTSTGTTETKPPEEGKSLLNEEEPAGAPEAYKFKAPEGQELNKAVVDKAIPIFKELNLSNEQAQKLVDFYTEQSKGIAKGLYDYQQEVRRGWQSEVKEAYGTKLPEVKAVVGRALNSLDLPAETVAAFRQTMDATGAGDNLGFIKVFEALAKKVTEGRPVVGNGPSKFGQQAPGTTERPSAARALYPNLPSSAPQ